ncbi:MAG: alpha/beta hydrolase fold domain-containing protein [Rhodospirillaceae bacterium]|nr:alpha/beta hydrolase fold domain-containing protein [Rhodospirillaceae bacterium]
MRPEDYPPQEPPSPAGKAYAEVCVRRSAGIVGEEVRFGADPYQSLAVYRAERPNGTVYLFWHGGGWTGGYMEWMAFMAPAFTRAGVTFVSAGYRLAPSHLFPTGLDDCADAVAWVHANIAGYGGDPGKIVLGGHSAGGHYAALLAVARGWRAQRDLPGDVVHGCLPISGVYEFGPGKGFAVRPRFLGPESAETDRRASPLHNIEGTPPPFFIAYGETDFPHLMRQADQMAGALRAAGGKVETLVMPGRDHFAASHAGGEAEGPLVPRALAWMKALSA